MGTRLARSQFRITMLSPRRSLPLLGGTILGMRDLAEPVLHSHTAERSEIVDVASDQDKFLGCRDRRDLRIAIRRCNTPLAQPRAFGSHPLGGAAIEWKYGEATVDQALTEGFELGATFRSGKDRDPCYELLPRRCTCYPIKLPGRETRENPAIGFRFHDLTERVGVNEEDHIRCR